MTDYQEVYWRCSECLASGINPFGEANIKKCPSCGFKNLEFSINNFEETKVIVDPPFPELTGDIENQIETLLAILNTSDEISTKRYFEILFLVAEKAEQIDT